MKIFAVVASILMIFPNVAMVQSWPQNTTFWDVGPNGIVSRGANGCATYFGKAEIRFEDGRIIGLSVDAAMTRGRGEFLSVQGNALVDEHQIPAASVEIVPYTDQSGKIVIDLPSLVQDIQVNVDLHKTEVDVGSGILRIFFGYSGIKIKTFENLPEFLVSVKDGGVQYSMLKRCIVELERINRGSGKPAVTSPKPKEAVTEIFSDDDYPAQAARQGWEGTANVEVEVSADGLVSGCNSFGKEPIRQILVITTCDVISKRWRFSPALDAKGQATQASLRTSVKWALPKD